MYDDRWERETTPEGDVLRQAVETAKQLAADPAATLRKYARKCTDLIDAQSREQRDGHLVRTRDGHRFARVHRLGGNGHEWELDLIPNDGKWTPRPDLPTVLTLGPLDPASRIGARHSEDPPPPPTVDRLTAALVTAPHGPDAHGVPVAA